MADKMLKCVIEVTAGLIPGEPMIEHTRTWHMSRQEYDNEETYLALAGAANLYALTLQNPSRVNWVRLDWVWM